MTVSIYMLNGGGGSGQDNDTMLIKGDGWVASETINTITVGGMTTSFRVPTCDGNGRFGPLLVIITQPITTTGYKDVIVTCSTTSATTFTGYWYVSEGCGFNDIYRRGDIDPEEYTEDLLLRTIEEARFQFNGMVRGFLSSASFPFTLGNYPPVVIQLIADIAIALIYERKGTSKEYKDMSQNIRKGVDERIMKIRRRQEKLYLPDSTVVACSELYKKTDADYGDFSEVINVDD